MTDYVALYNELQDPKYTDMYDQQIANAMNTEMVVIKLAPALVDSGQIYNAIVRPEWDALDEPTQQEVSNLMLLPGSVDIAEGTNARSVLEAAFPDGTGTHDNVAALTENDMTRAQSMGFVEMNTNEISAARIWGAPGSD